MIGQTISHYKIIEKSRPEQDSGRGCSFRSMSGTGLGGGGKESPMTDNLLPGSSPSPERPARSRMSGAKAAANDRRKHWD